MTREEQVRDAARNVDSWIQDAVGDLAHNLEMGFDFFSEKWQRKIKRAKKAGCIDLQGWLADEYYNDVDTLHDLCGDRIYDEAIQVCGTYKTPLFDEAYIEICQAMKDSSHPAMVTALNKLIKDHRERIKKHEAEKLQ